MDYDDPVQDLPDGTSEFSLVADVAGNGEILSPVDVPTAFNGTIPRQVDIATTVEAGQFALSISRSHLQQEYNIGRVSLAVGATDEQLNIDADVYHHSINFCWDRNSVDNADWNVERNERRVNMGSNAVNDAAREALQDGLRV